MNNISFPRYLNTLFSLELFIIWLMGTAGTIIVGLIDSFLPSIIIGGILWCLMIWQGKQHYKYSSKRYWFGLLQLSACWTIFPLFKAIRLAFYSWSADALLFKWDTTFWYGESLPLRAAKLHSPWLSEFISFCYFSFYFLIIGSALFFFLQRKNPHTKAYFFGLMLMYLIGFIGYFVLPAAGPYAVYPEVFSYPVNDGAMTLFLTDMVAKGITGMDVFPSLHSGITLYILGFLFLAGYKRVALCLLPFAFGLIIATVYLHYHYGVDVIVGAILAIFVLSFTVKKEKISNGSYL